MAYVFTPTCPGTGPWYIDREDCIGDSLLYINANTGYLDCKINSAQGFKNKLINAQGLINQRGYISGTATTTANQYTLDRWRVVTLGQNLTFTTSQNVTIFVAPAGGVEQVIEDLNIETGTYCLSWTGTATATVNGVPISNGGFTSITGGSNVVVRFSNGTFSLPQFEKRSQPTNFEYRLFGTELILCQRYYEIGEDYTSRFGSDGYTNEYFVSFKVTKRVVPVMTFPYKTGQYQDPGPVNTGVTGSNVYYQYLGYAYVTGFYMVWDPIFPNVDAAPQIQYTASAEL